MSFFWWYLALINISTLTIRGIDKRKAGQQKRRIRERTLLGLVIAGGSLGALLGQYVFRHKTTKQSFIWRLYLILVIQIILIVMLLLYN